jgi:hypothetical protein
MRYYDKNDHYYKKLIATYENHEYQQDMAPIRYDEGLIAAATRHKKWSFINVSKSHINKGPGES